jgi:uncharacterized membrane protein YdbT with pleckstrin-like domain
MPIERLLGLKEDEHLVTVARAAVVTTLPAFFLAAVLISAAAFFLTPLLRLAVLGYVILGVLVALGLAIGLGKLMRWRGTALILTEKRLFFLRRSGLFSRNVIELSLSKISAVSYRVNGLCSTIFGYGTLLIATTASETPLSMTHLSHPDRLETVIAERLEQVAKGPGDFGEMLHAVSRLTDQQMDMLREEIDRTRRYRAGGEETDDIKV